MSKFNLQITEEAAPEEYEELANVELQEFNEFATKVLGEPLARPEKAIVKTYIAWKLGIHEDAPPA